MEVSTGLGRAGANYSSRSMCMTWGCSWFYDLGADSGVLMRYYDVINNG